MTEKLVKEFEKIRASLAKSKKIILADMEKIDEKYRRLAQEEKKNLTESLTVLNEQLKFYDSKVAKPVVSADDPVEEPEEEVEEEVTEEEEDTVTDTLFPENNEENEEDVPAEPGPVAEDAGEPDAVPAGGEPAAAEEPDDLPSDEPGENEEDEWKEISNEEPVDPASEGWPSMPEEWQ